MEQMTIQKNVTAYEREIHIAHKSFEEISISKKIRGMEQMTIQKNVTSYGCEIHNAYKSFEEINVSKGHLSKTYWGMEQSF